LPKTAQKAFQRGEKRFFGKGVYLEYMTAPKNPIFAAIKGFFSGFI